MPVSINETQDEIVREISEMNGDIEIHLMYIAGLAQTLPTMPAEYKTERNIIKGCHSNVLLAATERK